MEPGLDEHVDRVQHDEKQSRQQGADEQVSDRDRVGRVDSLPQLRLLVGARQHVTQQYEDDRRRDDLAEGSRRTDRAGRHSRVVAAPQHDRQGQQAHGDHGRADDSRARREQCAHHDHGYGEPPPDPAEELSERVEQVVCDAGTFQHQTHEHEQGDRDQRLVVHHAEDPARQGLEIGHVEDAEDRTEAREDQGHSSQGECDGIAGQQGGDNQGKQDERQPLHDRHSRPRRNAAMQRRIVATPCRASSTAMTGITAFSRYRAGRPPASRERSAIRQELATYGAVS